jgi:hypothetical protein
MQDRCMVCAEHTIGSKIVLDAPDGTPRGQGSSEARFGLFGDSANRDEVHGLEIVLILTQDGCAVCAYRSIGLEII